MFFLSAWARMRRLSQNLLPVLVVVDSPRGRKFVRQGPHSKRSEFGDSAALCEAEKSLLDRTRPEEKKIIFLLKYLKNQTEKRKKRKFCSGEDVDLIDLVKKYLVRAMIGFDTAEKQLLKVWITDLPYHSADHMRIISCKPVFRLSYMSEGRCSVSEIVAARYASFS